MMLSNSAPSKVLAEALQGTTVNPFQCYRTKSMTMEEDEMLHFDITPPKCIHRISISKLSGVPEAVKEASIKNQSVTDDISTASFSESLNLGRVASMSIGIPPAAPLLKPRSLGIRERACALSDNTSSSSSQKI